MKVDIEVRFSRDRDAENTSRLAFLTLQEWDCEPRGVLQYLRGVSHTLFYSVCCTKRDNLIDPLSEDITVHLVFTQSASPVEEEEILSYSCDLHSMMVLLQTVIDNQSSKCLTWSCCEQVYEEVEQAKASL